MQTVYILLAFSAIMKANMKIFSLIILSLICISYAWSAGSRKNKKKASQSYASGEVLVAILVGKDSAAFRQKLQKEETFAQITLNTKNMQDAISKQFYNLYLCKSTNTKDLKNYSHRLAKKYPEILYAEVNHNFRSFQN